MQSLPEFQNKLFAETNSAEFALAEAALEGFRIQARNYLELVSNRETLRAYLVTIDRIAKVQLDRLGFRIREIPKPDGMSEKQWAALKFNDPNVGFEKHDPLKGEIVHLESELHRLLVESQGKAYKRAAEWAKLPNDQALGAGDRPADRRTSTESTESAESLKQAPTTGESTATAPEEEQPVPGTDAATTFPEKPLSKLNAKQLHIINTARGKARAKLSDDLQVCWSECFTFTEGLPNSSTMVEPRRFFAPFVAYCVSMYESIAEALLVENPDFRTYENWLNFAAKTEVCEREELAPLWPAQYKGIGKDHPPVNQDQIPVGVWEEAMTSSWRIFSDHSPPDRERQSWALICALRDPLRAGRSSFLTVIHKAISARTPHWVARGIEVLGNRPANAHGADGNQLTTANEPQDQSSQLGLGEAGRQSTRRFRESRRC